MPYFGELKKALKTRRVSGFFNFEQKEKPSCYKVDARAWFLIAILAK